MDHSTQDVGVGMQVEVNESMLVVILKLRNKKMVMRKKVEKKKKKNKSMSNKVVKKKRTMIRPLLHFDIQKCELLFSFLYYFLI